MPLFASVDGVYVSGWSKDDVVERLNTLSAKQKIEVTLGDAEKAYSTVTPEQIGLTVSHTERIQGSRYPWYLRIVPTSLIWFGPFQAEEPANYRTNKQEVLAFLKNDLGESCSIPPKNATLQLSGSELAVVSATNGGTCQQAKAIEALSSASPIVNKSAKVVIPVKKTYPKVTDSTAQELADALDDQSENGVVIEVAGANQVVEQKEVLGWLSFVAKGKDLDFTVDPAKANAYLSKYVTPKVAKPAGVTKVTTRDFTEVSRVDGPSGQTLAIDETLANVRTVLEGKAKIAKAAVTAVAPKIEYARSYTKTSTGISALLQHYAEDYPGTYGVSFNELGGQGLAADYNSRESFITASTYKLFVAYSTLKRVEKGEWKWSDEVTGGRNLSICFDDMIVKSDNACAEAMYKKIGYQKVIDEARALGLSDTTLASDGQRTSAGDLALFLNKLENKGLGLKDESRSRLIDAMKRNVYRSGVPAGASGAVANKVGFLNGLLHDASLVYSPKGTYVLVIMSEGSTWANIAELTRKIEALR
jgi:beta-lactamase class A